MSVSEDSAIGSSTITDYAKCKLCGVIRYFLHEVILPLKFKFIVNWLLLMV